MKKNNKKGSKGLSTPAFHIPPQNYVVQSNKISYNNLSRKRLAFKSDLRKMKL